MLASWLSENNLLVTCVSEPMDSVGKRNLIKKNRVPIHFITLIQNGITYLEYIHFLKKEIEDNDLID